jgi:uncharacterized protein (DUF58 family)
VNAAGRSLRFKIVGNAIAFILVLVSTGFHYPKLYLIPLALIVVSFGDTLLRANSSARFRSASRALTLWESFRAWLQPPRRLHFSRSGLAFTGGIFGIGFAALNTANNLLYLLLGAMLGLIVLSGWLSEQALRQLVVRRRVPRGVTAGEPARIGYDVTNNKKRMPTLALQLWEKSHAARAFVAIVQPGGSAFARAEVCFEQRGAYPLQELTLATTFPFGLFIKERDITLPGLLLVWPRRDRAVRAPRPTGNRARRSGALAAGAGGGRGEYRGLRAYRPGDDPRDVHWRSSARLPVPVVREYERDESDTLWLCLDLRAEPGELAETAVEITAALAAGAHQNAERFGLVTSDVHVDAGAGVAQLDYVLDALASARFRLDASAPIPLTAHAECVLITAYRTDARYGDTFHAASGGV